MLIAAIIGYLLGALPCGYLVARAHGVNIFEVGSKSPGATNVRRILGKGPGNLVFVLDALKGAVAAGWPAFVVRQGYWADLHAAGTHWKLGVDLHEDSLVAMGVAGIAAAVIGHSFSIFMKFRGGKGVATTAGGFLVLMPVVILIGTSLWAATFFSSGYVSLASILAALSLPVSAYLLHEAPLLQWLALVVAVFIVILHRANIRRLLNGTENRFVRKRNGDRKEDKT